MEQRIYLDNAATTAIDPEVIEAMSDVLKNHFGNPSSIHFHGRTSKTLVENARKSVANLLSASAGEIFFTSCATEANNMAIKQSVKNLGVTRIISSKTEHPSVSQTLEAILKSKNIEVEYLTLNERGEIDIEQLKSLLQNSEKKTLVSLMYGNNEIGTIHPVSQISELCRENGALFHCDTVQAMGKYDINVSETQFSFISASAHKFHGPKGIGFLYVNSDNIVQAMLDGGGQERNMRSGTENIQGMVGLAKALELAVSQMKERQSHISSLKEYLKSSLSKEFSNISFLGAEGDQSLYTILNVSLPLNPKTELITFQLDMAGISASAGSACSSGTEKISPVLDAINFPEDRKAVRFSFSHYNTKEEIDQLVKNLKNILD